MHRFIMLKADYPISSKVFEGSVPALSKLSKHIVFDSQESLRFLY